MRRSISATLLAWLLALTIGPTTALAGGSSDSSGDGFHCYLFFSLPNQKFAQAMVNDSKPDEVIKKAEEYIKKYETDEGGTLDAVVGNIVGSVCAPKVVDTCAQDCERERVEFVAECVAGGGNVTVCQDKAASIYDNCLDGCRTGTCEGTKLCPKGERCCPDGECVPEEQRCPPAKK